MSTGTIYSVYIYIYSVLYILLFLESFKVHYCYMAQKYNLRSEEKEVVLSVQLQLCSDLPSSDFDILDLGQSDTEADASCTKSRSCEKFVHENQVPDVKNAENTQQVVKETILNQLEKINSRLDMVIWQKKIFAKSLLIKQKSEI